MEKFGQALATLLGSALYKFLDTFLDKVDLNQWIQAYGDKLMEKFLSKLDSTDVEKEVQTHVLDPVKKYLEKKLGVNL